MRVVVTGQIGLDKQDYLEEVIAIARQRGEIARSAGGGGGGGAGGGGGENGLKMYHIGERMYREAPDVPAGRILDLPLSRLNSLRRAVFKDILADIQQHNPKHAIINTHATFRWKHGLFSAFDFDQLAAFDADLYVCLVDNIETVHARMVRDHPPPFLEHTLKDLMVWREEEILATEILAKAILRHTPAETRALAAGGAGGGGGGAQFIVLARGRSPQSTAETLFRLIFRPTMKKVYPSFPMTHIVDLPPTLAEVDAFRRAIAEKFITFDPGDVDEKILADAAIAAAKEGRTHLETPTREGADPAKISLKVQDVLSILPDIDGQIYARDFLLVRQSDLVISYIPQLPSGKPGLSSGVERELQHAHDHARETYVIWKPAKDPSPFITQTAHKVFRSTDEAIRYFEAKGYFQAYSLFGG